MDLRIMKQILYDMGLLTLVRWLLQRAFKFEPLFRPGSELKRVPTIQKLKKINVSLNEYYAKSIVLSPCFFFLVENWPLLPPPSPLMEFSLGP